MGINENLVENRNRVPKEVNGLAFSSWSELGLNDIDFIRGKPIWDNVS